MLKRAPKPLAQLPWLLWTFVCLLALLCAILGYLQYRWTGQITEAERRSLYDQLRERAASMSNALDTEVSEGLAALVPSQSELEEGARESAYSTRYLRWKRSHDPLFGHIALVVPRGDELTIRTLDAEGHFTTAAWPAGWEPLHARLESMLGGDRGGRGPRPPSGEPSLLEVPRFADGREQEWLIAELDSGFMRTTLLPRLLKQFLGSSGRSDYDVDILPNARDGEAIYRSSPEHAPIAAADADVVVPLLQVRTGGPGRPGFSRGRGLGTNFEGRGGPPPPMLQQMRGERPPGNPGFGPARWQMRVRHRAGSLEALVAQTRRRNLGISGGILILILATVSMLVWLARLSQRLGDLQMRFVAGVSHELRTPLTVIRTCAYNLRSPSFRERIDQLQRYGRMIEAESEKLQTLVDQVLNFASAGAGHAVRERAPVAIRDIIEEELDARRETMEAHNIAVEEKIADRLPAVFGDKGALRHALRNLLDNALKYGAGGGWISVHAQALIGENSKGACDRFVEITVADRGSGIPSDEQPYIFDAFYRGRKPVQDQIHGTGLGLNLVKAIVEAHGGAVSVRSDAANGTEFVVRLPAESSAI
jgi:signal transduction histidine kinase